VVTISDRTNERTDNPKTMASSTDTAYRMAKITDNCHYQAINHHLSVSVCLLTVSFSVSNLPQFVLHCSYGPPKTFGKATNVKSVM